MRLIVFSVSLFFMTFSPALAERLALEVPRGKASVVYVFGHYRENSCEPGVIPQMSLRHKPKHGSVKFRPRSFRLTADAGKCAGRLTKGVEIVYTPARGFKGAEAFSVNYSHLIYVSGVRRTTKTISFSLNVR